MAGGIEAVLQLLVSSPSPDVRIHALSLCVTVCEEHPDNIEVFTFMNTIAE